MSAGRAGWTWQRRAGVGFWRAMEGTGASAAFSSRIGGGTAPLCDLNLGGAVGDAPERVTDNWARFGAAAGFEPGRRAWLRQVHGDAAVAVEGPGPAGDGDALATASRDVVLTALAADCLLVFVADPVRGAILLCHAGWRGLVADVLGAGVALLRRRWGSRPDDLVAAVGPGIGACCYEVDEPVISALSASAPWAGEVLSPPPPAEGTPRKPGRMMLDLKAAAVRRLADRGVPPPSVAVAGLCTACHPESLYSHRRDAGRTGRMAGVLWRL